MSRILILVVAIGSLWCSTANAFQGGGGESTKKKAATKKNSGTKPTISTPAQPSAPPVIVPQDLLQQLVSDDEGIKDYVHEGNDTATNFEAHLLDLDGDGKPEYLIRPAFGNGPKPGSTWFCGANGQVCSLWLYRKLGGNWDLLLSSSVISWSLTNSSTKGHRNINLFMGWPGNYRTTTYKFDGRKYNEVKVSASRKRLR